MSDKRLPDKAIDVIDEAGAAQRLLPAESRKSVIDEREIEETIARMTKIPVATLSQGDEEKLYHLPEDLKKRIFGQDEAVDAVVSAIRLSRAGFDKSDRPVVPSSSRVPPVSARLSLRSSSRSRSASA